MFDLCPNAAGTSFGNSGPWPRAIGKWLSLDRLQALLVWEDALDLTLKSLHEPVRVSEHYGSKNEILLWSRNVPKPNLGHENPLRSSCTQFSACRVSVVFPRLEHPRHRRSATKHCPPRTCGQRSVRSRQVQLRAAPILQRFV